jgi:MATE family multidrug resistance protein
MDDRDSSLATIESGTENNSDSPVTAVPGGTWELLKLAGPLIIANSFTTIQFTVDRAFLSQYNPDAMGASMPAAMIFWLGMSLLFGTAGYTSTFVAQYTGAGRPQRVGPAVWQGVYISILFGSLFWFLWPAATPMFVWFDHDPKLIPLEATYFQSLLAAATPMGIVAALSGFFSGRGDSWTVALINAVGTVVNIVLDYAMIFGHWGFPEMGIAGAGWATVIGSWASAMVAFAIFFKPTFRTMYASLGGWQPEADLLKRYAKYGIPAGVQWLLEAVSFTFFIILVGRISPAAANATSMTFTLNMLAFLPMMGLGQAVAVLVGQRLGENRPEIGERTTYIGVRWSLGYMTIIALVYLIAPALLMAGFRPAPGTPEAVEFETVAEIVPKLLICVAIYSIADALYVIFSFALRGAGDTRFVMWVTFALAWPVMILPTWYLVTHGYSIYWPWAFATAYVGVMAVCFGLRFRTGKWKSMRVIEAVEKDDSAEFTPPIH